MAKHRNVSPSIAEKDDDNVKQPRRSRESSVLDSDSDEDRDAKHGKSRRKARESSESEDERPRRRIGISKRKKRKSLRRHDGDSSSESDSELESESESESDGERRRRKRKRARREKEERERKKKKKEREEKRKRKKKEKKEKGNTGAVTNSWGKYGVIRETDMWNKRPEFTAWLLEVKQVNLESLPNWEEKQMFKDFMEDHNTATFPSKKYYNLDAYHNRQMEKDMKRGFKKAMESERTVFNDEEQRRQELMREREKQKEEEVVALKRSMQDGMAQAMKEQAQLREEMAYQYKLGNFEDWIRYVPDADIGFNSMNFYCNADKFESNVQLTEEDKELFRRSCFGNFISLPKMTNSAKIINHFIMRTGYYRTSNRDDVLYIEVGGEVRTFSQQDFAEITGLKFSSDYNPKIEYTQNNPHGIFSTLFMDGTLRKRDHINVLVQASKEYTAQDRSKYLLIYFLANVLLADAKKVALDTQFLRMVDDPEAFNNYPWGNVVWDFMVDKVRTTVSRVKVSGTRQGKTINLPGFFIPLQIWAYETMPIFLERKLCELVAPEGRPLMRRWAGTGYVTEKAIAKINLGGKIIFNPISVNEDTGDEQLCLEYHPKRVPGGHDKSKRARISTRPLKIAPPATTPHATTPPATVPPANVHAPVEEVIERLETVDERLGSVESQLKGLRQDFIIFKRDMSSKLAELLHSVKAIHVEMNAKTKKNKEKR